MILGDVSISHTFLSKLKFSIPTGTIWERLCQVHFDFSLHPVCLHSDLFWFIYLHVILLFSVCFLFISSATIFFSKTFVSLQGGLNSSNHNILMMSQSLVFLFKPSERFFQKNHELPQNCEFFIILQGLTMIMKVSIKDLAEFSWCIKCFWSKFCTDYLVK